MSTTRNLVNLSSVGKDFAARMILEDVTLGIADRDRIGVVGGNGQGKSTLLELIAGNETPDEGQVIRVGGLRNFVRTRFSFQNGMTIAAKHAIPDIAAGRHTSRHKRQIMFRC